MPELLVQATGISRSFGGIHALRDVSLDLQAGEVHGLIGPNGSGKSTLMKIISGLETADTGSVLVRGEPLRKGVAAARAAGITIVAQEISVVPGMTVEENIVVGAEPALGRMFWSRSRARRAAVALLSEIGCEARPDDSVADLQSSQRRLVMLAAALHRGAQLLILDEPTAGLASDEIEQVLAAIARLKAAGRTVLFVSHRLDELITLSDRLTVLREGQVVARFDERRADRAEIVELLAPVTEVGAATASADTAAQAAAGPVVMRLEDGVSGLLRGLSLEVKQGECVGIVGGLGSGVREAAEVLSGSLKLTAGKLTAGTPMRQIRSVSDGVAAGVLFVSGERHRFVIGDREVGFHVCLPSMGLRTQYGFVRREREREAATQALAAVGVSASADQPLKSLSGGNQQRALFARAALGDPRVIVVHEPSVGVDVHGRELLRDNIRQLRREHGVVIVSSDPEEVVGLCDSVKCLRHGRESVELRGEQVTVASIFDAVS